LRNLINKVLIRNIKTLWPADLKNKLINQEQDVLKT
jgi:hypothetical protein